MDKMHYVIEKEYVDDVRIKTSYRFFNDEDQWMETYFKMVDEYYDMRPADQVTSDGWCRISKPRKYIEKKCCNKWIALTEFSNSCETCGATYDMHGYLLRPVEQWED